MFRILKKTYKANFVFLRNYQQKYDLGELERREDKISLLLERNDDRQAELMIKQMKREQFPIRDTIYYNFLLYYCFNNRREKVFDLIATFSREKFELTTPFYNVLLRYFYSQNEKERFMNLIVEMRKKKEDFTFNTYKTYLRFAFKIKDYNLFEEIYKEMKQEGYDTDKIGLINFFIDFDKYDRVNEILQSFALVFKPEQLQKFLIYYLKYNKREYYFNLLKGKGIKIDYNFYVVAVNYYIRNNELKNLEDLLTEVMKDRIELDDRTYTNILKHVGANSEKAMVIRYMDYLRNKKINDLLTHPLGVSIHISILIRFDYDKRLSWLLNILRVQKIVLTDADYNMVIQFFYNRKLSTELFQVLKDTEEHSIGLSLKTIKIVIHTVKKESLKGLSSDLEHIMNYLISILIHSEIELENQEILRIFMYYYNTKQYKKIDIVFKKLKFDPKRESISKFKDYDKIFEIFKNNTSQEECDRVLKIFNKS